MAFKQSYKIPDSLDKSWLDPEIRLSKNNMVKPLPLKVLMFYMVSLLGLFWLVGATPLQEADFGWIALAVLWWVAATFFFGQYSKTKELRLQNIMALINYVPKANRRVTTRSSSPGSGFYSIAPFRQVEEDGLIRFADGSVGQAYLVVGSASVLVFEQDKRSIINRVDSFYRKIDTSVEYIWMTTKEPQRVFRQLANLERKNLNLQLRDPELFALLDEQHSILTDYVGSRFSSIHQYLILRADNEEALRRAHALLEAEVQESALMVKNCSPLDGREFTEVARSLYSADA